MCAHPGYLPSLEYFICFLALAFNLAIIHVMVSCDRVCVLKYTTFPEDLTAWIKIFNI